MNLQDMSRLRLMYRRKRSQQERKSKTEKKEQKRKILFYGILAGALLLFAACISVIKRIKYRASFMVCGILLFL
jgi:hypothetical protein